MEEIKCDVERQVLKHFEIKKRLGKGAYGIVWKAISRTTNDTVALKKIFDAFCNKTDAQRTFREVFFLRELGDHPNIVRLYDIFKSKNRKDIYLVFEYMETDLHKVIKRGNILHPIHKQFIMYQLLSAVTYLHSAEVIHRDLKPSNVLIDSACRIKLCDFGLARSLVTLKEQKLRSGDGPLIKEVMAEAPLTEYVATRWYRAPEILLASGYYTKGVDLWSLGCILGEMLLGKPLFSGSSALGQLERIIATMPHPLSQEDLTCIKSPYGTRILSQAILKHRKPVTAMLPATVDRNGVELMSRLLQFNPLKRATICEALDHTYVRRFRRAQEQLMTMSKPLQPPVDDNVQLSVREYRKRLFRMAAEHTNMPKLNAQKNDFFRYSGNCSSKLAPISSQYAAQHPSSAVPFESIINRTESAITRANKAVVEVSLSETPPNPVSTMPKATPVCTSDSGPIVTNQHLGHSSPLIDAADHLKCPTIHNKEGVITCNASRLKTPGQDKMDGKARREVKEHLDSTVPQTLQRPSLPQIRRSLSRGTSTNHNPCVERSGRLRTAETFSTASSYTFLHANSVTGRARGRMITPSIILPERVPFCSTFGGQKATWNPSAVAGVRRRQEMKVINSNVRSIDTTRINGAPRGSSSRSFLAVTAPLQRGALQTIHSSSFLHSSKP